MSITISEPILVHAPEMTEAVSHWGVYAIPRMWREPTGELIVRFNGEEDSADIENMNRAPNLYFTSWDNGKTWAFCPDGNEKYSVAPLTGVDPPYKKLRNGDIVFVNSFKNLPPITGVPYQKEFIAPCRDAVIHTYRWGDIPPECRKLAFGTIKPDGTKVLTETDMDFPEREIHVVAKANSGGEFVTVPEYVQAHIFRLPYFSAVCQRGDELLAVCCGQHPDVAEKYYTEVYLIVSTDGGKTWKKRATIAGGITNMPYGFGGDASEVSMTIDGNGNLYCVMRMDMSSDPRTDPDNVTDTILCFSRDGGYTWCQPRSVSDSSVTPHIVSLKDTLVLIYGRPGVHIKYSTDRGETWSQSYPLIGKTLEQERADGRDDFSSKYGSPSSYCNTFWDYISDKEIIVLYNDLRYPDKNGVPTKAAFVRTIKIGE